ncbi:MAG: CDP-alcohol phosphatidyltransferase family protein [Firmicutes bacterium]|nr:CDP-alcohol phosphatidyltransferase family protein [Bacillota bacterium]
MIGYWNYTVYATYASALSALFGFMLCLSGRPLAAVVCLLLSAGLDMIDGRIARTKTDRSRDEKRFGVQLDSLADLLAFGALPALIFVSECRLATGRLGLFPALLGALFALCCLIRLAFFNVRSAAAEEDSDRGKLDFKGLPAPSIALPLALIYCFKPGMGAKGFLWLFALLLLLVGAAYITPFTLKKPGLKLLIPLCLIGVAIVVALLIVYL